MAHGTEGLGCYFDHGPRNRDWVVILTMAHRAEGLIYLWLLHVTTMHRKRLRVYLKCVVYVNGRATSIDMGLWPNQ